MYEAAEERVSDSNVTLEKKRVVWKCRRENYVYEKGGRKWSDDGVNERAEMECMMRRTGVGESRNGEGM